MSFFQNIPKRLTKPLVTRQLFRLPATDKIADKSLGNLFPGFPASEHSQRPTARLRHLPAGRCFFLSILCISWHRGAEHGM